MDISKHFSVIFLMHKYSFLLIFLLNHFIISNAYGICTCDSESVSLNVTQPDTLPDNQTLFVGRIWNNLYYRIEGDQFLFSSGFLPGSVTINGKTFENIDIKYDIYKDEILTLNNLVGMLQLNKEMVDSFSFNFQNQIYHFIKMPEDSLENLKGYINELYKGKTALYVKYIKRIDKTALENRRDRFYQINRIFFIKDKMVNLITSKKEFFKLLNQDKTQIRNFIKKNKLDVSKKVPESFIPVVRYYDSLNQ